MAEIIEQQRREHEIEPGAADRLHAEMAHVRVERLGAGHRQHDRAEQNESAHRIREQEIDAVRGIEREQDLRMTRHLGAAETRQHDEPHRHDRAEELADYAGAAALEQEQRHQQHDRDRQDVGLEHRRRDLKAFDRAQHRNRGRDDAVAVEQGGADHAGGDDPTRRRRAAVGRTQGERGQRQDAAFAAVVGAHDDDDVFEGDDDEQRPGDQRQHAQDRFRAHAVDVVETLPDGIERRRADIAVDHAQRADDQPMARAERGSAGVRNGSMGGGLRHVSESANEAGERRPARRPGIDQSKMSC